MADPLCSPQGPAANSNENRVGWGGSRLVFAPDTTGVRIPDIDSTPAPESSSRTSTSSPRAAPRPPPTASTCPTAATRRCSISPRATRWFRGRIDFVNNVDPADELAWYRMAAVGAPDP